MHTLRQQVVRLARQHPEFQSVLVPLLRQAKGAWSRKTITIPTLSGEETVAASVRDNWAVYKNLRGSGWTIAHAPTGMAMRMGIKTKGMAVAIMDAVAEQAPAILRATDESSIMRHKAVIVDVLRNPPEVQSRGRGGPRKPKALPLDFEGILSDEGLSNQGERSGKAGEFWGIRGNGRMIALGRRDVLRNVFFVEVLHGGSRLGSRWLNAEGEYQSKMTEERLRKWAKWAKGGYSTRELREIAREEGRAEGSMRR